MNFINTTNFVLTVLENTIEIKVLFPTSIKRPPAMNILDVVIDTQVEKYIV